MVVTTSDPSVILASLPHVQNGTVPGLILLDYDGTLVSIVRNPSDALIALPKLQLLAKLTGSEGRHTVWVISGRDQEFLSSQFDSSLNIGLFAEHGAFVRYPNSDIWIDLGGSVDVTWMPHVKQSFDKMVHIFPETHVEMKKAAIVWHYRGNESECREPAIDLINRLLAAKEEEDWKANITTGKCVVEVRPSAVDKGFAVGHVLNGLSIREFGYVLCVGDDQTDEDMFSMLASYPAIPFKVSIHVGTTAETMAMHRVASIDDVWQILAGMLG